MLGERHDVFSRQPPVTMVARVFSVNAAEGAAVAPEGKAGFLGGKRDWHNGKLAASSTTAATPPCCFCHFIFVQMPVFSASLTAFLWIPSSPA
jgi:hypothetical protein